MKALLMLPLAALGCQSFCYETPDGERFTRASFGQRLAISELVIEQGSNGIRRVMLKGYNSDISEQLSAVAEGAARGVVSGIKP